uniref:Copper transport protein n=1 Tax=Marmota marmota marmota TaxID=9994 RepID=A0A8C5YPD8_MARMA
MAMHFIFSDEAVLLFDFWSVHSPAGMALSVLVVLLLAVLYEGIKVGKAKLLHHTLMSLPTATSQQLILETDQDSAGAGSDSSPVSSTNLRYRHWAWGMGRVLTLTLRGRLGKRSSAPVCRRELQAQGRTRTCQSGDS